MPAAAEAAAAEDQMVDQVAVDGLGNEAEPARRCTVGWAWADVAAGMIVGDHESLAAMKHRIFDDGAKREGCVAGCALVPRQVQAPTLFVQVRDPQALSSRAGLGEAAREERACRLGPPSLRGRAAR